MEKLHFTQSDLLGSLFISVFNSNGVKILDINNSRIKEAKTKIDKKLIENAITKALNVFNNREEVEEMSIQSTIVHILINKFLKDISIDMEPPSMYYMPHDRYIKLRKLADKKIIEYKLEKIIHTY